MRILYLKSPFVLKNVIYLIVLKNCQHLLSPYVSSNLTAIVFLMVFLRCYFCQYSTLTMYTITYYFRFHFIDRTLFCNGIFMLLVLLKKISIQKESYLLHSLLPLWGLSERESLAMVWEQSYQSPLSQKTPLWALN